jgi:uncharacterized protein YndB with AHSA1/START domain
VRPALLLALAPGCAATGDGAASRSVETTVLVPAPPERVLRAFLEPADLRGWWKVSRSLVEAEPGGVWSVTWDDYGEEKTQHAWVGVVEELTPRGLSIGHLVMIEPRRPLFAPLQLEVLVTPAGEGTSLTVVHRGYGHGEHWDWIHAEVVRGWQHVLGDLQAWFRGQGAATPGVPVREASAR